MGRGGGWLGVGVSEALGGEEGTSTMIQGRDQEDKNDKNINLQGVRLCTEGR